MNKENGRLAPEAEKSTESCRVQAGQGSIDGPSARHPRCTFRQNPYTSSHFADLPPWAEALIALRYVQGKMLRTAVAATHQIVRKHPAPAVFLGAAVGYLLTQTKVK